MQKKFEDNDNAGNQMIVEQETADQDGNSDVPELRSIRSADDAFTVSGDHRNYDQYLKDAESGKDLKEVIQHLVQVIKGKDDQINLLLSEKDK